MIRPNLTTKLWLAFSLLILVVLIPLELSLHRLLTEFYRRQVTDPLLYHSEQLARTLADESEAISGAASIGRMVGGEVVVVDSAGAPVSFPGQSDLPPPGTAVVAALNGSSYVGETPGPDGDLMIVTAVPIPGNGGAVLLLAPAEPLQRSLTVARRYLWLAGIWTLGVGAVVAWLLSRQLLRPVLAMEQAMGAIAQGDLETRVAVTSGDELGRLANGMNQMTIQLHAYQKRRQAFLANVAHELRTPLSYIRGYTQALSEGLVPGREEQERYMQIVQEESVRLGRLVDDLLDLAQMEEGELGAALAPLQMAIPIQNALETIRPLAEEKGVELISQVPADLPLILGDAGRLHQVVVNLLDNGLRHTPPGGKIMVTAAAEAQRLVVQISDTGTGLDPEILPLVFERFQKHDSAGRGLGLAIVRSIVRAHGGEVGAANNPAGGARFWFTLRTAPSEATWA